MNCAKRILSGALVLTLLTGALTGCESKPAADDMAYKLTGIARDTTLMTVNGQKVTTEEYLFWLNQSIAMQKQYGNLADDAAWETETDGKTAAQYQHITGGFFSFTQFIAIWPVICFHVSIMSFLFIHKGRLPSDP